MILARFVQIISPCVEMDCVVLEVSFDTGKVPILISIFLDSIPCHTALLDKVWCNAFHVNVDSVEEQLTFLVKLLEMRLL